MSSNYLGRIVGSSSLVDYASFVSKQNKAQSKDLQPANDHIQYFPEIQSGKLYDGMLLWQI